MSQSDDSKQLQEDLDHPFEWSVDGKVLFHPDKCKVLNIRGRTNTGTTSSYHMSRCNERIVDFEVIIEEKDIGVTIESRLNFEKHIEIQINKANMMVGIIRRPFKYMDMETFCLLFKALVCPHLEYASSVWSP